jgi:HSP20 family protein
MFYLPISRPHAQQPSRWLDGSLDRFFGADTNTPRSPALDVAESDSAYTATLEMPGVAKENIQVSVEGRVVTVQAHEQAAQAAPATETSAAETPAAATDRVVYRERSTTRYARRFSLPVEVEQGATVAKLDHGVLTLTLPKRSVRSAAQVTVN